jgi:hypothetical protein
VAPGRCLAYGDGVTLWALAEIVKAQAGISEQDTPRTSPRSCAAADDARSEDDAGWVESHLLALVGLPPRASSAGRPPQRGVLGLAPLPRGLAEQRPLVLVFEDLHWADESLLDFVDELVDWVTDVPLLVVATARPELLERRRTGVAASSTRRRSRCAADRRADGAALGRASRRPSCGRDAERAPRAGGREPALRRAVRGALRRARID